MTNLEIKNLLYLYFLFFVQNKIRTRDPLFKTVRQCVLSIRRPLNGGRDVRMYFNDSCEDLNSAVVVTMLNSRAAEHLVCD